MADKKSAYVTWYRLVTWLEPAARDPVCPAIDANGGLGQHPRRLGLYDRGPGPGYQPQDDTEAYAAEIIAEQGEPDPEHDPVLRYLGGEFTLPDAQVPQA
jgi:uronate dehydrogenase